MQTQQEDFPFVKELVTDAEGNVHKVIIDIEHYQQLLEALEDEVMFRAIEETEDDKLLNLEQALAHLEEA